MRKLSQLPQAPQTLTGIYLSPTNEYLNSYVKLFVVLGQSLLNFRSFVISAKALKRDSWQYISGVTTGNSSTLSFVYLPAFP
jgi:hypothetical protein